MEGEATSSKIWLNITEVRGWWNPAGHRFQASQINDQQLHWVENLREL
jgi:hypothetical protein